MYSKWVTKERQDQKSQQIYSNRLVTALSHFDREC